MGHKRGFEAAVLAAFLGSALGWFRDVFHVSGLPGWLNAVMGEDYTLVSDGATAGGRGVTAWDVFRKVGNRYDLVSIKTLGAQRASGTVPVKLSLLTGNWETSQAILRAILAGTLQHYFCVLVWEARGGGYLFGCVDLAPAMRAYGVAPIEDYPEGGYKDAPAFYYKWSSKRASGVKRWARQVAMGLVNPAEYPRREGGVLNHGDAIQYQELCASGTRLGIKAENLTHVNTLEEIPPLVETTSVGFGGQWD